jgi:hypothetical protein
MQDETRGAATHDASATRVGSAAAVAVMVHAPRRQRGRAPAHSSGVPSSSLWASRGSVPARTAST